jgi:hypothetical protein
MPLACSTRSSGTRCHRLSNGPDAIFGGDAAPKIEGTIVVALYDVESGRIHHIHIVHVHEGGRHLDEAAILEQARHHAGDLGHNISELRAAFSRNAEHGRPGHRIDVETGAFIPMATSGQSISSDSGVESK